MLVCSTHPGPMTSGKTSRLVTANASRKRSSSKSRGFVLGQWPVGTVRILRGQQLLRRLAGAGGRTRSIVPSLEAFFPPSRIPETQASMDQAAPSEEPQHAPVVSQERVVVTNKHGEKLVGVLHDTGSKKLVILCHGFRSTTEDITICNLTAALTSQGISVFCFDFAGNGESEGTFQFGNYRREADDLRSVVLHFSERKFEVSAILGHSKGGNVVLLYASMYHDVPKVVNVSGRFALEEGLKERLGEDFMQRIKNDGFIDMKDKTGKVQFRVTEESLMDRLNTDMHAASLSIDKNCRVLTIHGSADDVIPAKDAFKFHKVIPNHKVHIIEGANHPYTKHQAELVSVAVDFIKSD